MDEIRWQIYKALSWAIWWVCPKKHRCNLNIIWCSRMNDDKTVIAKSKFGK